MSEVTLKINNRGYSLACDNGQEARLNELGHYVDSRLRDISAAGAATNESHLLVLTSLVLADEVYELRDEVAHMNNYIRELQDARSPITAQGGGMSSQEEKLIVDAIEHLAEKIQKIAGRVSADAQTKAA